MAAGPPVDLSAYAGQRLGASTLRAATADIMADITALLAGLRQQTPPAVPYDPAAASEIPSARTSSGTQATPGAATQGEGEPGEAPPPEVPAGQA
jgi:hypothetical protein